MRNNAEGKPRQAMVQDIQANSPVAVGKPASAYPATDYLLSSNAASGCNQCPSAAFCTGTAASQSQSTAVLVSKAGLRQVAAWLFGVPMVVMLMSVWLLDSTSSGLQLLEPAGLQNEAAVALLQLIFLMATLTAVCALVSKQGSRFIALLKLIDQDNQKMQANHYLGKSK